ncbi:hypothetical protein EGW08_022716, partial [Elysia chlorotica]
HVEPPKIPKTSYDDGDQIPVSCKGYRLDDPNSIYLAAKWLTSVSKYFYDPIWDSGYQNGPRPIHTQPDLKYMVADIRCVLYIEIYMKFLAKPEFHNVQFGCCNLDDKCSYSEQIKIPMWPKTPILFLNNKPVDTSKTYYVRDKSTGRFTCMANVGHFVALYIALVEWAEDKERSTIWKAVIRHGNALMTPWFTVQDLSETYSGHSTNLSVTFTFTYNSTYRQTKFVCISGGFSTEKYYKTKVYGPLFEVYCEYRSSVEVYGQRWLFFLLYYEYWSSFNILCLRPIFDVYSEYRST